LPVPVKGLNVRNRTSWNKMQSQLLTAETCTGDPSVSSRGCRQKTSRVQTNRGLPKRRSYGLIGHGLFSDLDWHSFLMIGLIMQTFHAPCGRERTDRFGRQRAPPGMIPSRPRCICGPAIFGSMRGKFTDSPRMTKSFVRRIIKKRHLAEENKIASYKVTADTTLVQPVSALRVRRRLLSDDCGNLKHE
jgi:hypothetical protein